jgi:hypothetical protein
VHQRFNSFVGGETVRPLAPLRVGSTSVIARYWGCDRCPPLPMQMATEATKETEAGTFCRLCRSPPFTWFLWGRCALGSRTNSCLRHTPRDGV